MTRKKISYSDYALLRMDDPNNLMVITGLMTFDMPLEYEGLKNAIEHSMLPLRRFRQRLVPSRSPFRRPYWEDDPNFNIETHLERVELPPPADQSALLDFISQLMSTALETSRPPWQFYLVENYVNGSAFIARLHHSIADGIALMEVLLSLTEPNPSPSYSDQLQVTAQSGLQPANRVKNTLKSNALNSADWTMKNLWQEGKRILFHPSHARRRTRQVIDLAATVGRLAVHWPDPPTVFKGPLGVEKRAAWSKSIALKDVKDIGKTFSGTVNDVLLTAVAGALGQYIAFRGEVPKDVIIRGFIPVNLRPLQLDEELGNKFGLVFLSMPVGIDDPIEQLCMVKQNMDALKSSSEPLATFGVLNLFGAVPETLGDFLVDFFDTKGTAVMTNVPGPQEQRYLAGVPINTVMAWVPQTGRIAVGVSIISYNGKVRLGIATDKGRVPDPEVIIDFFNDQYEEMKSRAQKAQAERQKYVQPMVTQLDQALQNLDELLAQTNKDLKNQS